MQSIDQKRITPRQAVLIVVLLWVAYWGQAAYFRSVERDQAQNAWFEADARGDWAAANAYEQTYRHAARGLVRAIAWGFVMPLSLVIGGEVGRVLTKGHRH